jgi:hypothetical protein
MRMRHTPDGRCKAEKAGAREAGRRGVGRLGHVGVRQSVGWAGPLASGDGPLVYHPGDE